MLRVRVDVNGRDIGEIAIVRVEESGTHYLYNIYDSSDVDSGESVTDGDYLGTVAHRYTDGAAKLVELVMAEIGQLPD